MEAADNRRLTAPGAHLRELSSTAFNARTGLSPEEVTLWVFNPLAAIEASGTSYSPLKLRSVGRLEKKDEWLV